MGSEPKGGAENSATLDRPTPTNPNLRSGSSRAAAEAPFLHLEPAIVTVHALVSAALAMAFTFTDANRFDGRLSPIALLVTFCLYLVWWLVPSLLGHLPGGASLLARVAIAAPTASLAVLLIAPVQNGSYTLWMYGNLPIVAAWTAILFVTTRPDS